MVYLGFGTGWVCIIGEEEMQPSALYQTLFNSGCKSGEMARMQEVAIDTLQK
jgi:hypothetical protein